MQEHVVAGVPALQATPDPLSLTGRPPYRKQMQEHRCTRAAGRNLDMIQAEVGHTQAERYQFRRQEQSWEFKPKLVVLRDREERN